MGIDLEHPRGAPDAQAFNQTRDDTHNELHRGAFAMKDRTVGFVEVSVAGATLQLPPGTATRSLSTKQAVGLVRLSLPDREVR